MRILDLPPSLLWAVFTFTATGWASSSFPTPTPTSNGTQNRTIASTGSGASYASACWSAQASYSSAYTSYNSAHQWVSTTIQTYGPTSWTSLTYYENATTLCDGHPRVTYSPAISLYESNTTYYGLPESTSTILGTYFSAYQPSAPSCSIKPTDCDPLWAQYSSSVSAAGPQITAPPIMTPPCANSSQASENDSAYSEIYGCGKCTMYGEGVQLVFFPTTVSRDMCASTPTASLTHYGSGAVITAYAGKSSLTEELHDNRTVFADGHAFTTGTAYISISTVYAVNRCSKTFGSPVKDAILAMPSESILSLRYSQDHFQRLMETDRVTGYPVSYADFNSPVPWSAWNGQVTCDPGGFGGYSCSIIYESQFRPQLAIPPEITQLAPEFEGCQMWYNGLWDPPLALQPQATADGFLPPGHGGHWATSAAPTATPGSPTAPATALPDQKPTSTATGNSLPGPTRPADQPASYGPQAEPWTQSFQANGHTFQATGANGQVLVDGVTLTSGGPTKTLQNGVVASYGSNGLALKGSSTVAFDQHSKGSAQAQSRSAGGTGAAITSGLSGPGESDEDTTTITVNGQAQTVVQHSDGGVMVIDSATTLTPGGAPTTLANGEVMSAASNSLVFGWSSTLGSDAEDDTSSSTGMSGSSKFSTATTTSGDGVGAQAASMTESGPTTSKTGSGSRMSSSQALSFFAALIALTFAVGT